jgi:hypothetical protein
MVWYDDKRHVKFVKGCITNRKSIDKTGTETYRELG